MAGKHLVKRLLVASRRKCVFVNNGVETRLLLGDMELLTARGVTRNEALKHEIFQTKYEYMYSQFCWEYTRNFLKFHRLNLELYP